MKKVLSVIIVTALALSLLAGCGAQTQEAAPAETKAAETAAPETAAPTAENTAGFKMGYYVNEYEEEIEGSKATRKDYIILLDDGKGFYSAQDIVDITWNRDQIAYADGKKIDARQEGEDIIITENGQERVFKLTVEDLPEDLYRKIDENLNARNYEGTFVSAEGAPHKITMTVTKGTEEPYAVTFVIDDNEELKGTGGDVDGGAEIGLKDSKGNALYGVLFPVIDKYTFRVTQSDISFIEPETDFADLVRQ